MNYSRISVFDFTFLNQTVFAADLTPRKMCALFYFFLMILSFEKITECKYPFYIKLAICHLWLLRCWPVYLTRLDFGLGILLALMLLPNGFCGKS